MRIPRKSILIITLLLSTLLASGCVVVPPRSHYAHAWMPGHWAPGGVWIRGHYR